MEIKAIKVSELKPGDVFGRNISVAKCPEIQRKVADNGIDIVLADGSCAIPEKIIHSDKAEPENEVWYRPDETVYLVQNKEKTMTDFTQLSVGTKVWSFRLKQWGTIDRIYTATPYPTCVQIGSTIHLFTADGKNLNFDKNPDLFLNSFEIPEEAFRPPLPDLPVDTPIIVRKRPIEIWQRAHFCRWGENDKVICFVKGQTSFTATAGATMEYAEWKLPEGGE